MNLNSRRSLCLVRRFHPLVYLLKLAAIALAIGLGALLVAFFLPEIPLKSDESYEEEIGASPEK
jgi:hypothetical protein